MKNIIKISLIAVALFVVSCNKEVIRPNSPSTDEISVLKSGTFNNPTDKDNPKGEPGITDPNNDPDMIIKKVIVIKPN